MRKLCAFFLVLFVSACASQRPQDASRYETDMSYAKEAYPFVLLEKTVYDDPSAGVMLRYADGNNPGDWISVSAKSTTTYLC